FFTPIAVLSMLVVAGAARGQDADLPGSTTPSASESDAEAERGAQDADRPTLAVEVIAPDGAPAGPGRLYLKLSSITTTARDQVSIDIDEGGHGAAAFAPNLIGPVAIAPDAYFSIDSEESSITPTAALDPHVACVTLTAGANGPIPL